MCFECEIVSEGWRRTDGVGVLGKGDGKVLSDEGNTIGYCPENSAVIIERVVMKATAKLKYYRPCYTKMMAKQCR